MIGGKMIPWEILKTSGRSNEFFVSGWSKLATIIKLVAYDN